MTALPWLGVCLLVLSAPFEGLRPLVKLPGQSLSSTEAVILLPLAGYACVLLRSAAVHGWWTPLSFSWLAFAMVSLAAGWFGTDRSNALHAVGRLGLAFGIFMATIAGVTTMARLRGVLTAFALSGAITSLLIILDYLRVPWALQMFEAFRAGDQVVGAHIRASGPFQYPTIASMYLEVVFPLALGLLLVAIDQSRVRLAVLLALVLLCMAEAITLTFTRAGLATALVSLAVVGGLRFRQAGLDRGVAAVAVVAAGVVAVFAMSRSAELWSVRLSTEGQTSWYRAAVDGPPSITVPAGASIRVPVRLTNTGRLTWTPDRSSRFYFSAHWLAGADDIVVVWNGPRGAIASPMAPGASVVIDAELVAPGVPGQYRVLWDIEYEHRLWFSTEPGALAFTTPVIVTGPAVANAAVPAGVRQLPRGEVRPGRFVLWQAAFRMFAARPLLGVGPDNFRLQYGDPVGLPNADRRVHSNNMYLEILAGGGLVGAAAFLWFFWRAVRLFLAAVWAHSGRPVALGVSIAAAGGAIALHGLVDSFLTFTATYAAFAVVLGLAVAWERLTAHDAHRV